MVTTDELRNEIGSLPAPDVTARTAATDRVNDILRPAGATTRLDSLAIWLAGWQATASPTVEQPAALIFAGDHGVVAEGVSAYPAEVTQSMLAAFKAEKASVSALARVAGATVSAIDVGVGEPTGNLRVEPAMSAERFAHCFSVGRAAVSEAETDLLIVGEMGIGNTTAAAAVSAALVGGDVSPYVGRGTGVGDDALSNKAQVVTDALQRIDAEADPLEVLRQVGGTELVAIAGAIYEARTQSLPVLLDGYISTAPALALHAVDPTLIEHCQAAHCSAEPGHQLVLDHLGLQPLLTLDLRLGEASGAMAAVPLVRMACALVNEVPTFTEWFSD